MRETPPLVRRGLLLHVFNTRRTGAFELSFWFEQPTRGPPRMTGDTLVATRPFAVVVPDPTGSTERKVWYESHPTMPFRSRLGRGNDFSSRETLGWRGVPKEQEGGSKRKIEEAQEAAQQLELP